MLSILIAQYNYDVRSLIDGLLLQLSRAGIKFEIIVIDDFSDKNYISLNDKILINENVSIYRNSTNKGRSYSRNLLAEKAQYDNLLFIDCDAEIYSEKFIINYLSAIEDYDVICGGTVYDKEYPGDKYVLRWRYGKKREEIASSKRSEISHRSFSSFNFLIRKELIIKAGFDKSIRKYGHEDTLFGIQLLNNKLRIKHIDNPLIHKGVENNEVFVSKSLEALDNLFYLYNNHSLHNELTENIKILAYYKNYRSKGFHILFKIFYQIFNKLILKNLLSSKPNLTLFDIYKLGYLCSRRVS